MEKIVKYIIDISILYFLGFVILMGISYLGPKGLISANSILFDIFRYGFILFWVYCIVIVLRLTRIISMEKVRFVVLVVLLVAAVMLYIIAYKAQF